MTDGPYPDSPGVRDEVAAAYADPSRGYHDTRHLTEVLDRLDELAGNGAAYDATPVLLAAWFHDAVYDGERDAEERSAAWAEDALAAAAPAPVGREVARLVRLTETHTPDDGDANGCALSDADLGILAAPRERYDEYVAAVRREYAHLRTTSSTPAGPTCCGGWPPSRTCSTRLTPGSSGRRRPREPRA